MRSEDSESDTQGECSLRGRQLLAKSESQMQITGWFRTSERQAVLRKRQNNFHGNRLSGVRRTEVKAPCANSVLMRCLSHCLSHCLLPPREPDLPSDTLLCPKDASVETMPFPSVSPHIGRLRALFLPCKCFGGLNGAVTKYFVNRSCWTFEEVTQG